MTNASEICSHMNVASPCVEMEDGDVVVNTHCMYPSNGSVQVYVSEVPTGFVVSDGGGAMRELVTAGAEFGKHQDEKCLHIAQAQGLKFDRGVVQAPTVPAGSLALAVIMVANVSKEIADQLFAAWKPKRERDFKRLVREMLTHELRVNPTLGLLYGKSNKHHKFDNVFTFPSGKRAAVDAVVNDANSMNSRVLANLDVITSDTIERVSQAIIYDDSQPWKANDLSYLHISRVPIIPFSQAGRSLQGVLEAA